MTAWIVSMGEWASFLKPEMIAPIMLLIGVGMHMTAKTGRMKDTAKILIGFGMLFTGLSTMSSAVKPYTGLPVFSEAFRILGSNPLLGILTGAIVTGIIQSSSASMGILQTLAAAGAVNWGSAVYIAMGQNIGTCVTALLSAVSGDTNAKRAAMIHLEFNVIGALMAAAVCGVYFMVYPTMMTAHVSATALALFHTGFNLIVTMILFPFANQLVALSKFLVPDQSRKRKGSEEVILDPRFLSVPQAALNAVRKELHLIGAICESMIADTRDILIDHKDRAKLIDNDEKVQKACLQVREYLTHIEPSALTPQELERIERQMLKARDLLQIGSSCRKLAGIVDEVKPYDSLSPHGIQMVNTLSSNCIEALKLALHPHSAILKEENRSISSLTGEVFRMEATLGDQRHLKKAVDDRKLDEAWLLIEAADCYRQIARRTLRIQDENQWQSPGLLLSSSAAQ